MHGIIYNSVGTLRFAPRYTSELVTQALLGSVVKILEERNEWIRIQTPDSYTGWIKGSVQMVTEEELNQYLDKPKVIVTSTYAQSYEEPQVGSMPVTDLVIGNILVYVSENNDYYKVTYPDCREAFIKHADVKKQSNWFNEIVLTGESIVNCALRFKGIPYLWGGTSSKGLDCSGLTKMVYLMHGINIARDASQQVKQGALIDSEGDFDNLLPGDLLFFGSKGLAYSKKKSEERVVHVGIYIGNNHFIHASDYVRISSLNPDDKLYDDFNRKRYLRTKRYIDNGKSVGVNNISLNNNMPL